MFGKRSLDNGYLDNEFLNKYEKIEKTYGYVIILID
jgi:hypothetical protein